MAEFDTIIIGAGIAGMTAAIYLKRENINVAIIEKEMPGGQMVKTPAIENYPGFERIDGSTLAMNIYNQVEKLKIPFIFDEVIDIQDGEDKLVITKNNRYRAKTILLSTGRIPRKLNLMGEDKLIGRGISYCATCDGAFYKDKDVVVVGGGSSAVTEAIYLTNIARKVILLYRGENLRSENVLKERLENIENAEIKYNTEIIEIKEQNGKVNEVILNNGSLKVDGIFVFIGYEPNVKFLKDLNLTIDNGYIVVDDNMKTTIDGIYAAGDSIKKQLYQLTTAAAEAAIAANSIKKYLVL